MADHRSDHQPLPDDAATGPHLPDEAVVAALALDVALDLCDRTGDSPRTEQGPGDVRDDLLEMAASVRAVFADGGAAGTSSAGLTSTAPASLPFPATGVPLRPVSLAPLLAAPHRAPGSRGAPRAPRRARRRQLATVAAVAASAAALALGADVALQSGGGTAGAGWAVPSAVRTTLAGGRLAFAPAGNGPSSADRITAVTCTTAQDCLAVADAGRHAVFATSEDGGTTWQRGAAPPDVSELLAVLCASPQQCWAVGSGSGPGGNEAVVTATDDGGRTWTSESVPAGVTSLRSIACADVEACWAVGSTGSGTAAVVATDDGGRTWIDESAPVGVSSLQSISCPTVEACWAGGRAGGEPVVVDTTDGGHRWEQQAPLPGDATLAGATPASPTVQPPSTAPSVATVSSITCSPSPAPTCWAAITGADGTISVLDGGPDGWHVSARAPDDGVGRSGFVAVSGCRAGCSTMPGSPPDAALAAIERATAPSLRHHTAGGAVTCPTAVECWVVQTSGSGFTSTALGLGPTSSA